MFQAFLRVHSKPQDVAAALSSRLNDQRQAEFRIPHFATFLKMSLNAKNLFFLKPVSAYNLQIWNANIELRIHSGEPYHSDVRHDEIAQITLWTRKIWKNAITFSGEWLDLPGHLINSIPRLPRTEILHFENWKFLFRPDFTKKLFLRQKLQAIFVDNGSPHFQFSVQFRGLVGTIKNALKYSTKIESAAGLTGARRWPSWIILYSRGSN